MGLGLLASKAMRPPSRFLLGSQNPNNFHLRTIVSKPELRNPEASTAQLQQLPPPPDLPPWFPLTRARVHFSNPEDAIEVFVEGYAGIDIPRFCYHTDSLSAKTIACASSRSRNRPNLLPLAPCPLSLIRDGGNGDVAAVDQYHRYKIEYECASCGWERVHTHCILKLVKDLEDSTEFQMEHMSSSWKYKEKSYNFVRNKSRPILSF